MKRVEIAVKADSEPVKIQFVKAPDQEEPETLVIQPGERHTIEFYDLGILSDDPPASEVMVNGD